MPQEFNVDEIFTIAVDIEKNGEAFYRRAAELATDQDAKKLLTELADWERGHIKIFKDLHARVRNAGEKDIVWDPYGEVELYLQAVASRHVFTIEMDHAEFVEKHNSLKEILEFALARERDSVVFYTSLDMVLSQDLTKGNVKSVIREEVSHIRLISEKLAQLG